MKSFVPYAVAVATVLMIQPITASAQQVYRAGHPHVGHGYAGHGPGRYQHGGYAHGYAPGYGAAVGAAALATGVLVGGAIATQNQGYYPDQLIPDMPRRTPDILTRATCIATPLPPLMATGIPSPTVNKLTDRTIQPAAPISVMTDSESLPMMGL